MLPRQEPVGLLVSAVRRRIRQVVHAEASRHRLAPQQFWVLVSVHEAGSVSLGALAERLHMDQPTASRVVASLAARKLLRMTEDPADRRRVLLAPTPAGADLAARLRPVAKELRSAAVSGFTGDEEDALRRLLRRVLENLDRFEGRRARHGTPPPRGEDA